MVNSVIFESRNMCWETPPYLFDKINAEFSFTLDAAASTENAKVAQYYTETDDALKQTWNGNVWLNHPYGRQIVQFMQKACEETTCGNSELVVCLVPVRSDTKWWHHFAMQATEIRLFDRRVRFVGAEHTAPFPSCLVVFRNPLSEPPPRFTTYEIAGLV